MKLNFPPMLSANLKLLQKIKSINKAKGKEGRKGDDSLNTSNALFLPWTSSSMLRAKTSCLQMIENETQKDL